MITQSVSIAVTRSAFILCETVKITPARLGGSGNADNIIKSLCNRQPGLLETLISRQVLKDTEFWLATSVLDWQYLSPYRLSVAKGR